VVGGSFVQFGKQFYPYNILLLVMCVFGYNSYLISCDEKSGDASRELLAIYYYYCYNEIPAGTADVVAQRIVAFIPTTVRRHRAEKP